MTSSKPASAKSTLGRARKAGAIHVCPLSAVPHTVARSKASHLLTWLQDEIVVETPRLILPDRHIRFHIHDISEPLAGYAAPGSEHIDQLIEFAHALGRPRARSSCTAGPASAAPRPPPTPRCAPSIRMRPRN